MQGFCECYQQERNYFSHVGKIVWTGLLKKKTFFLSIVKPGRQNHPHSLPVVCSLIIFLIKLNLKGERKITCTFIMVLFIFMKIALNVISLSWVYKIKTEWIVRGIENSS